MTVRRPSLIERTIYHLGPKLVNRGSSVTAFSGKYGERRRRTEGKEMDSFSRMSSFRTGNWFRQSSRESLR